eukprot:969939-Rhodomonas_salina.1
MVGAMVFGTLLAEVQSGVSELRKLVREKGHAIQVGPSPEPVRARRHTHMHAKRAAVRWEALLPSARVCA